MKDLQDLKDFDDGGWITFRARRTTLTRPPWICTESLLDLWRNRYWSYDVGPQNDSDVVGLKNAMAAFNKYAYQGVQRGCPDLKIKVQGIKFMVGSGCLCPGVQHGLQASTYALYPNVDSCMCPQSSVRAERRWCGGSQERDGGIQQVCRAGQRQRSLHGHNLFYLITLVWYLIKFVQYLITSFKILCKIGSITVVCLILYDTLSPR